MVKALASLSYYSRKPIFSTDVGTNPTLPLYNLNLLIWVEKMSQIWCTSHRTRYTSASFYKTTSLYGMTIQVTSPESIIPLRVSPYAKFKMALKSKEVQRQYSNLRKISGLW
jgi:hypothetical protein